MNAVGWGIFAAIFAVITPLTILVMREVIRRRRSALLGELLDTLFKGNENISTLELARNKYGARPGASEADQSRDDKATARSLTRPYALLISAIPYLLLCIIGFLILIEPICALISTDACFGNLIVQSLIWIEHPGSAAEAGPRLLEAAAIVGAAFLGGYLFTLRTLLRAVMNFELSPITWLRAAVHILSGSIVALLLYRTLGGTPYLSDVLQITGTPDGEPLRLWLAVAFIAGYVPDFGLSTLVRYQHITYLKNVDDAVMKRKAPPSSPSRLSTASITTCAIVSRKPTLSISRTSPPTIRSCCSWKRHTDFTRRSTGCCRRSFVSRSGRRRFWN